MSSKIETETFIPSNYHRNEYNFQRNYAESILRAQWHISFEEWCQIFFDRGFLRDYPPVTTNRWLTRKNSYQPFTVDNIRIGSMPESGKPLTETYRLVKGEWRLQYRSTKR